MNLKVCDNHFKSIRFILNLLYLFKHLSNDFEDDAILYFGPHHGICFSSSGCSVSKDSGILAINDRGSNLSHRLGKDLVLGGYRVEDMVKHVPVFRFKTHLVSLFARIEDVF